MAKRQRLNSDGLKQDKLAPSTFHKETGKLDNWIYHKRIDEYIAQKTEAQ